MDWTKENCKEPSFGTMAQAGELAGGKTTTRWEPF